MRDSGMFNYENVISCTVTSPYPPPPPICPHSDTKQYDGPKLHFPQSSVKYIKSFESLKVCDNDKLYILLCNVLVIVLDENRQFILQMELNYIADNPIENLILVGPCV